MAIQIRNQNDETDFVRYLFLIGASLAGCIVCWWATGPSLGLFFGGLFIATFLAPAGVLAQRKLSRAVLGSVAIIAPVAAFWLAAVFQTPDTFIQWIETLFVLCAYTLFVAALALALSAMKFPEIIAATLAVTIGLMWLTWPIWLSTPSGVVHHLALFHPPLVINGVLISESAWTERSVAYHLTNLNQDVPLQLPSSPWPCIALHGIVAITLWALAKAIGRDVPTAVSC